MDVGVLWVNCEEADLCGLALLLQLLQLLSCNEADRLVPGDELGACWHAGQNNIPSKITDTAYRTQGG